MLNDNNKEKEELFVNNRNLVYSFMQKNKRYLFLFDSPEDMLQELFLELWRVIDKYNNKNKFGTFVNMVLHIYCKQKVRRINASNRLAYLYCVNESDLKNDEMNRIIDNEYNALDDFIHKYNEEQMRETTRDLMKGYNYKELGKKYNKDKRTIKKWAMEDYKKIKEK